MERQDGTRWVGKPQERSVCILALHCDTWLFLSNFGFDRLWLFCMCCQYGSQFYLTAVVHSKSLP